MSIEQIELDNAACETRHRHTEMVFAFGDMFLIENVGFWKFIGLWMKYNILNTTFNEDFIF